MLVHRLCRCRLYETIERALCHARTCSSNASATDIGRSDVTNQSWSSFRDPLSRALQRHQQNARVKTATDVLVTQRIGLTDVCAVVRQGRLEWGSACCTRSEEEDDRAAASVSRARAWVASRIQFYRGHAIDQFKALYLPVGFPHTVKDNYVRFSCMAALSNFFISLNTILSSTFLLYAVGLGAGALPVSGALNWVIKDGIGQAGTLLCGRMVAHDFDLNTRSWNFVANFVIALACVAEITTVYHPEHFLVMASIANIFKGVSFMAGGSTRAAFNISFAQGENIADITAKSTSQYVSSTLLGTCVGILITGSIGTDANSAVLLSMAISGATALATYGTIRSVPLANLNSARMQLLINHYLRVNAAAPVPDPIDLPKPSQLCASDPVIMLPVMSRESPFFPPVEVNTPLMEVLPPNIDHSSAKLAAVVGAHRDERHLLLRDGRQRYSKLHVVLHSEAMPEDAIAGFLHALLLRREIKQHADDVIPMHEEMKLIKATLKQMNLHRDALIMSLRRAQWNLDRVCIEGKSSRGSW